MSQDDRLHRNFVLQQGLPAPATATSLPLSTALVFQPRLVAPLIVAGTLFQSAPLFLLLAGLQWWSALFPALNPFDFLHRIVSRRWPGAVPLPPAPPPRRFAMGLAGVFAALTGLTILNGWWRATYVLEGFLLLAVTAVAVGRFCLGSFLYYLLRGQTRFALQTLPWGRGV